jgi:hypothetical protein
VYGTRIFGSVSKSFDTSITLTIAGEWENTLFVGDAPTTAQTAACIVAPAAIHPPNSVPIYSGAESLAGDPYTWTLQARDAFYNNALTTASELTGISVIAQSSENVVMGTLEDRVGNPGTYTLTVTPTLVGTYTITTLINGLGVSNNGYKLEVKPAASSSNSESILITSGVPLTMKAGEDWTFVVESRDQYGNLRPDNDDTSTFD